MHRSLRANFNFCVTCSWFSMRLRPSGGGHRKFVFIMVCSSMWVFSWFYLITYTCFLSILFVALDCSWTSLASACIGLSFVEHMSSFLLFVASNFWAFYVALFLLAKAVFKIPWLMLLASGLSYEAPSLSDVSSGSRYLNNLDFIPNVINFLRGTVCFSYVRFANVFFYHLLRDFFTYSCS